MESSSNHAGALVMIMEPGAPWPASINRHRNGSDTVVIAQQSDESAHALLRRLQRGVNQLRSAGRRLETALLAVHDDSGHPFTDSRTLIAHSLLHHVREQDGTLVLIARGTRPMIRHELAALVGALTEQLNGSHASIQMEFDAPLESLRHRRGRPNARFDEHLTAARRLFGSSAHVAL